MRPRDAGTRAAHPSRPRTSETSTWAPGTTCLRTGTGEPLLYLPGLSGHASTTRPVDRRVAAATVRALARRREVWWVDRRTGLEPDVTMAALADDYARTVPARLGTPVDVVGVSTGGSVALQLAADHPAVVRRLVLVCAAARLGPRGRAAQRAVAEALRAGDRRAAGAAMTRLLGTRRSAPLWSALGWVAGPWMFDTDPADLLATIAAEDAFDLTDRLREVTAPVLLVAGGRDGFYGPDLFAATARGLPDARLVLYPRASHAGVASRHRFADDVLSFLDDVPAAHRAPAPSGAPRWPR
jgi:pimeloyl-ACP methyl ester carboxylesterase